MINGDTSFLKKWKRGAAEPGANHDVSKGFPAYGSTGGVPGSELPDD
jgi:hypothetical protein